MINRQHRGDPQPESTAHRPGRGAAGSLAKRPAVRTYSLVVTAMPDASMPHKPLLALRRHLPVLEYLNQQSAATGDRNAHALDQDAWRLAERANLPFERVRQLVLASTDVGARLGRPLWRPLLLRAGCGETIHATVTNLLPASALSLALLDDDYGIQSQVEARPATPPGHSDVWTLRCTHAGIFPICNRACPDDAVCRGRLGMLIVEA